MTRSCQCCGDDIGDRSDVEVMMCMKCIGQFARGRHYPLACEEEKRAKRARSTGRSINARPEADPGGRLDQIMGGG